MSWFDKAEISPLNVSSRLQKPSLVSEMFVFLKSTDKIYYHAAYDVPPEARLKYQALSDERFRAPLFWDLTFPAVCFLISVARRIELGTAIGAWLRVVCSRCFMLCPVKVFDSWGRGQMNRSNTDEITHRARRLSIHLRCQMGQISLAPSLQHLCPDGIFFAMFWNKRVCIMIFKAKEWDEKDFTAKCVWICGCRICVITL